LCKIARVNEILFEQNFQGKKEEKQQELESGNSRLDLSQLWFEPYLHLKVRFGDMFGRLGTKYKQPFEPAQGQRALYTARCLFWNWVWATSLLELLTPGSTIAFTTNFFFSSYFLKKHAR
jgi:hypothetical protein